VLAEPFLAPAQRFENRGAPTLEWLRCAATEQYERLRAHSSLWNGTSTVDLVAPILGSPLCSPEMERRRQLVLLRTGQQRAPEATRLLAKASEDNLNPAFWRGD
jgi:hypothetical protein